MKKRSLAALAAVPVLGLAIAACSSSSSTVSGTETLSGAVTGKAAIAALNAPSNAPFVFPVFTWAGPVNTSVKKLSLGGGNKETEHTFKAPAGDFTVTHTPNDQQKTTQAVSGPVNGVCTFHQASSGVYTVLPGKSTGSFAGATGHGTFTITITGSGPVSPESAKTCTFGANGPNVGSLTGASIAFKASGPLAVKS